MFGMRYAIDVVFLDDALRILHVEHALAPGKVSPKITGTSSVLELAAGSAARAALAVGTELGLEPAIAPAGARAGAGMRGFLRAFRS
jgi:uncharacterized membrane protein (UPF0127 family)